jgi:hypothetical protein
MDELPAGHPLLKTAQRICGRSDASRPRTGVHYQSPSMKVMVAGTEASVGEKI